MRVMFLLLVCLSCQIHASEKSELHYKTYISPEQQVTHILEIDLTKFKIVIARAKDVEEQSRETVDKIAQHFNASAGINGGFFKVNHSGLAVPAGILKINKQWHGIAYKPRGAIGWSHNKEVALIDILQTKTYLEINKFHYPVHKMNQITKENHATLFSDSYNQLVEFTQDLYVMITNNQVKNIYSDSLTEIPINSYLYSLGKNLRNKLPPIHMNSPASINVEIFPQIYPGTQSLWNKCQFILGGAPVLISRGFKVNDYSKERLPSAFLYERHARTAVGILPNKHWVFVIAEQGMTIPELANTMLSLGCTDALNLDGGSSSSLYLSDHTLNHSHLTRKVSDALLVIQNT